MSHTSAVVVVLTLIVTGAGAELVLLDDFEGYDLDTTIHFQGTQDSIPMWYAQRNSDALGDHGWSRVALEDGDNALKLINRDYQYPAGDPDTVYTSMYLGTGNFLTGAETTLYFRWKPTGGANDLIVTTNDKWPGYDYDGMETGDASAPSFQLTNNYRQLGVRVRAGGGGQPFRAADGSYASGSYSYYDIATMTFQDGQWYEMWMWIDNPGDTAQFWVCPDGGTPVQMIHDGDDGWWDHYNRDHDTNSVMNLKFLHGISDGTEKAVFIDTIAVDIGAFTHDRIADIGGPKPGDADLDGDVDLDDFVLLKSNFGTGTTWGQGDFDGDGDVDLDDFVILKQSFGT